MKFNIIVDIHDCPYKGSKPHYTNGDNRLYYKCRHEHGFGECCATYSTFKELCPLVKSGCLIGEICNMSISLIPCAHCGHDVEFTYDKYADINIDNPDPFGKIYCIGCGIQTGELMTLDEATEVWNARYKTSCPCLSETDTRPVCLDIIPTEALRTELTKRGV